MLDGLILTTATKDWQKAFVVIEGLIAIMSNDSLFSKKHTDSDKEALAGRLTKVILRARPADDSLITSYFTDLIRNEAVGLAILNNALYIRKQGGMPEAETPDSFKNRENLDSGWVSTIGLSMMSNALLFLDTGSWYPESEQDMYKG